MADAGEANLYHSGGSCAPMGTSIEEWYNCEKKNGADGVGSKPKYTMDIGARLNYDTYPAPDIEQKDCNSYAVACEKGPNSFSISRYLNFNVPDPSGFGGRLHQGRYANQDGLIKWWRKHLDEIVDGYCLNVVHIPPKTIFDDLVWCVDCPIEGLVFDIVEKFTGTVLAAGIDGSVEDSGCITVPDSLKYFHDCNMIIQLKLVSVPPLNEDECKPGCGSLEGLCVMVSPIVRCPSQGK